MKKDLHLLKCDRALHYFDIAFNYNTERDET